MKKFWSVLFVALLAISASAITLELTFGDGVQHNASNISATVGAPSVGSRYYFTQSGVSTTAANAFVVSEALVDGTIVFSQMQVVGNCTWEASIDGNVVEKSLLNGRQAFDGQKIVWSAKPTSLTDTYCKLVFDLNVVSA